MSLIVVCKYHAAQPMPVAGQVSAECQKDHLVLPCPTPRLVPFARTHDLHQARLICLCYSVGLDMAEHTTRSRMRKRVTLHAVEDDDFGDTNGVLGGTSNDPALSGKCEV